MSTPPRHGIPRLSGLDLVIETGRLRLRPFVATDVDALWPVVSDPEFPTQMTWAAHTDPDETLAFIESTHQALANNTGVAWAIEHEGIAVGCISLEAMRWELRALRVDRAELGYWLAPRVQRRGLMTEAARAVVLYGFDTIGLHKINVGCLEPNLPSRRVIEKVGFRFIGRLEEDVWRVDRWETHLRYELTSPEWSDVSTTMPITRLPLS